MRLTAYLKDKFYLLILFLTTICFNFLLFFVFKAAKPLVYSTTIILTIVFIISLLIDYIRKQNFYTKLLKNIEYLDKAYLVLETIDEPNFYEGKLLTRSLYEINKSMNENIHLFEEQVTTFKEFIEMWIHEVKIPIASLILMAHNHPNQFTKKQLEQLRRISDYVDQVLYYVRSENAEKDYLINEISLDKVITNVALKNKDDFLENNIDFIVTNTKEKVLTDSKWLEFILNQIINNAIKYRKTKAEDSYIKIEAKEQKDKIILTIEDNGIGIPKADLTRVFEKSFTGRNGRKSAKSTGIGLYLTKNLCNKLGHTITIESEEGKYTRLIITFSKNNFFDVVR